jgi:hypothetical protein
MVSDPDGYRVFGKKKHIVRIDDEMAKRAFDAMYGVWDYLLKKEARSRRRKKRLQKVGIDNKRKSY